MKTVIYSIIGIAVIALVAFVFTAPGKPGKYDTFAQCIKDSGAQFYGAFWCPHCQKQKGQFGKSAQYLPYIECSTPDSQGVLPICVDAGITAFPTWRFIENGTTTQETGELSFETLAQKTNCPLPQQ